MSPNPARRRKPSADARQQILVSGAREHNLRDLSVAIPRNQFVVLTGVSGSGKSTLAFDLLFAEGQRRFLDSMNTYARQFVEQLARPDVDRILGLPPTVSIEQRLSRGGGKSTVATVTEVHHFLRLLFARLGTTYCPRCQLPVGAQTRDALGERLREALRRRGDLLLLAPVIRHRKGFHTEVAAWAAAHGFAEIRADGRIHSTRERLRLDRFKEHNVEIVVGVLEAPRPTRRAPARPGTPAAAALDQALIDRALELGQGTLLALDNHGQETVHATARTCAGCGDSFPELDPKNFSYNSPRGWCPRCRGFGALFYLPDVDRGARADAIEESWFDWQEGKRELCPDCQGARLNPLARAVRLELGELTRATSSSARPDRSADPTQSGEARLRPLNLWDLRCCEDSSPTIDTFGRMAVGQAREYFAHWRPRGRAALVARDILPEIRERLKFLAAVGLDYLELGRAVTTLSSGEAQRIRLAAQLGSNLSGVLYILDEPTIGLHARDCARLLATLAALRARGNSLVVVEHDEETMRHADHIIDLGPGAGVRGGRVVACGTLSQLRQCPDSLTGQCLRQPKRYPTRGTRRPVRAFQPGAGAPPDPDFLVLHGARKNNLKDLTVAFPLRRLVVVTGVSGSGKSTLLRECLLPAVQAALQRRHRRAGRGSSTYQKAGDEAEAEGASATAKTTVAPDAAAGCVTGHASLRAVYEVDQSPIGRTPRSIPATYVGFFTALREVFAQLPEARLRGYSPSRFSFNSPQGRCPACAGAGVIKLEMNFLPPAFVRCETCGGTRYNPETLAIELRGLNIARVLDLSVAEAIDFFGVYPTIRRPLEALRDTGLDYVKLGQTSPTLSGGEAQRLKLVTHLLAGFSAGPATAPATAESGPQAARSLSGTGPAPPAGCLFLLEEPTIGLHMADVRRLLEVLHRLVDAGHSVLVIEHNLDLIAEADWLIDLGPEGGEAGGRVVATGTPETIARTPGSYTGHFLRPWLKLDLNTTDSRGRGFQPRMSADETRMAGGRRTRRVRSH